MSRLNCALNCVNFTSIHPFDFNYNCLALFSTPCHVRHTIVSTRDTMGKRISNTPMLCIECIGIAPPPPPPPKVELSDVIQSQTYLVNARRACARGLQYFVCLFVCLSVCYQSPGFFSRLYDKLDLPACSSLVFLGFQLTDFDKTVSFGR